MEAGLLRCDQTYRKHVNENIKPPINLEGFDVNLYVKSLLFRSWF